ncbi:MAG: lipoate--protein ligase family protein [Candidatus Odinarchaeota archaeon]|nr:lipoate--protein ligase family protein [Candidatus Odinarchaeota archaeon]
MRELRVIIDFRNRDPYYNLALDESMTRLRLENKIVDTLRFWIIDPVVIIGYFQKLEDSVNVDYCKANDIGILRRVSSGGAVYCDNGVLLFSLIIDTREWPRQTRYPRFSYEYLSKPLLYTLKSLCLNADFLKPNVVTVNGRKISGLAQFYLYDVLLFHGTVLINPNFAHLVNSLKDPLVPLGSKKVSPEKGLITLSSLIPNAETDEIADEIIHGFIEYSKNTFSCSLTFSNITRRERKLAEELKIQKYFSSSWLLNSPVITKITSTRSAS